MGLGLALAMRLGLLSIMSWLVALTDPVFSVWGHPFSFRDLILLGGGLFLLFKATTELHERLEALPHSEKHGSGRAGFWVVIAQILLLDAVFSLDSIITAVGMVDNLYVMMSAVVIAMIVMICREPSAHGLCQPSSDGGGALPLVPADDRLQPHRRGARLPHSEGLSLRCDRLLDPHRILQPACRAQCSRNLDRVPFRERTTDAIVRLMSRQPRRDDEEATEDRVVHESFGREERQMVEGVLTLADRNIKTIMTPRSEIAWLNSRRSFEENMKRVQDMPHSSFPVCDGTLENVIGVVKAKDLIGMEPSPEALVRCASERQPLTVPETINVIRLMQNIKSSQASLVLVTDEFGVIQGLTTSHDILEAIAGDFPDEGDRLSIEAVEGGWSAEGSVELFLVEQTCGVDGLMSVDGEYVTLAGLLLDRMGRLPPRGTGLRRRASSSR